MKSLKTTANTLALKCDDADKLQKRYLPTRRSLLVLALAIGTAVTTSVTAHAQQRNQPSNQRQQLSRHHGQRVVTVQYRNSRNMKRTFTSITQAKQFVVRMRRLGYTTRLQQNGRQFTVNYRQSRYQIRKFTGRHALIEAMKFKVQMRRRGYETRMQTHFGKGSGNTGTVGGKFSTQKLIGLSEKAARRLAEHSGFKVRIASRDGRSFVGTRDYRRDRVNLSIVKGRVVRARIG